jgi:hypothetical protein
LVQFAAEFAIEDQPELLCGLVSGVGVLNLDTMSSVLQLSRPISRILPTNYPCVYVYLCMHVYVYTAYAYSMYICMYVMTHSCMYVCIVTCISDL